MFGKIRDTVEAIQMQVKLVKALLEHTNDAVASADDDSQKRDMETYRRLDSIETWMELAVDTKADEIAERFDALLREHNGKVTNQVLKDLVRQAAKGQ